MFERGCGGIYRRFLDCKEGDVEVEIGCHEGIVRFKRSIELKEGDGREYKGECARVLGS